MVTVIRGRAAERERLLRSELERLTGLLRRLPGIVAVYVFGSAVAGGIHAGSDLDLFVIRETDEPYVERIATLRRELQPRAPVDLFVYTPAEATEGGRFADDVLTRGKALW
ncbi:MAG: nucleotidyltransferase domain-containing protein [Acidimicrobiia bacterium]